MWIFLTVKFYSTKLFNPSIMSDHLPSPYLSLDSGFYGIWYRSCLLIPHWSEIGIWIVETDCLGAPGSSLFLFVKQEKDQRSLDINTAKCMLGLLLGKIWPLFPVFHQFLEVLNCYFVECVCACLELPSILYLVLSCTFLSVVLPCL